MSDTLHRFLFDDCEIRGEHLLLDQSYREILANHHYPPQVAQLLGEFLAAAGLLSATLKFNGSLILQVRGDGEIPLIMAEANSDRQMRAIARGVTQVTSEDFHSLLGNGQLAITIDPEQGQRYQGIVSLEGNSLAECIEAYFRQSEQLETRLWLTADGNSASGMLLQQLPGAQHQSEQWQHLTSLADTLTEAEMLQLEAEALLYRLYHQEALRLFDAQDMRFLCSCSQERMERALLSIGLDEVNAILAEQGEVESHCEFCHRQFRFSPTDIAQLFAIPEGSAVTRH